MIRKFVQHVVPGVVKPMRVLWNEIIAFVFAAFAILGGFRAWRETQGGDPNPVSVGIPVIWTAVMTFFAVTSYVRARRISRS